MYFGIIYYGQPVMTTIYQLLIALPSLGVTVRRLHDVGFNGWWCLVPLVNIILIMRASQPDANKYGPNPK